MARVGGRNAFFAWVVGLGSAAILAVLVVLALPLLPASFAWVGKSVDDSVNGPSAAASASPAATDGATAGATGTPTECKGLYDQALWATLRFSPGSNLTPSTDAPVTTATALVTALQPRVTMTCTWRAEAGTVSTTFATVPPDAGAIAAAALPASGFGCEAKGARTRCTRTDGDLTETIEAGGGLWLSTSESGWHPADYVGRTAQSVWG